jgi:exopolysaccharide production protein ExoZ
MKRIYSTLQAGRGLAALGVILYHCALEVGLNPSYWHDSSYIRNFAFGRLGVEFFFVLSGMLILLAHWDDVGKPATVPSYLWKRFRRVYPIYWVVLLPVTGLMFSNSGFGNSSERSPWTVISSFLLIHIHTPETVLQVAWTLFEEVEFYGIFLVVLLSRRWGSVAITIWLCLSIVGLTGYPVQPLVRPSPVFSPFHVLFGFGMLAAWIMQKYSRLSWQLPLVTGAILVAVAFIEARTHEPIITVGVGFTLLTVACIELERQEHLSIGKWLLLLGDASYSLYLIHYPLLAATFRVSYRLDSKLHFPVPVWFAANAVLAIAVGVLFHLWCERPLLGWLSKYRVAQRVNVPAAQTFAG